MLGYSKSMTRADPQLNLRLPSALKTRIESAAAENRRSVTAEIINRLEESFELIVGEHIDMRGLTPETLASAVAEGIKLAREQDRAARAEQDKGRKKPPPDP